MSSLSKTPNLNLPQFTRDDRPAWIGDITPAFSAIDQAYGEMKDKIGEIENQFPGVNNQIAGVRADMTELANNTKQELNQSITQADTKIEAETERATAIETALESRIEILEMEGSLAIVTAKMTNTFFNNLEEATTNTMYGGAQIDSVDFRLTKDDLLNLFPGVFKDNFEILKNIWNASVRLRALGALDFQKSGHGITTCVLTEHRNVPILRIFLWQMKYLHQMENNVVYLLTLVVDKEVVNL